MYLHFEQIYRDAGLTDFHEILPGHSRDNEKRKCEDMLDHHSCMYAHNLHSCEIKA